MSTFRQLVSDTLNEKRKISAGTLKTYTSLLCTIIKRNNLPEELGSFDTHVNEILEYIEKKDKPQSRKTALSGLYVLTGNEKYQKQMVIDMAIVNKHYKEKVLTPERQALFKSQAELKILNDAIISKYKKLKTSENLNDAVISVLHSGAHIPPRRLELATVKTKDFDKEKDNFIIKNKIYLNQYKTSGKYGQQIIELPKDIMVYINKAVKDNTSGMLFETKRGKPYSTSSLSKRLTEMFGISADLLRSSYINNELFPNGLLEKMQTTATQMGNSIDSQFDYYAKTGL